MNIKPVAAKRPNFVMELSYDEAEMLHDFLTQSISYAEDCGERTDKQVEWVNDIYSQLKDYF